MKTGKQQERTSYESEWGCTGDIFQTEYQMRSAHKETHCNSQTGPSKLMGNEIEDRGTGKKPH